MALSNTPDALSLLAVEYDTPSALARPETPVAYSLLIVVVLSVERISSWNSPTVRSAIFVSNVIIVESQGVEPCGTVCLARILTRSYRLTGGVRAFQCAGLSRLSSCVCAYVLTTLVVACFGLTPT